MALGEHHAVEPWHAAHVAAVRGNSAPAAAVCRTFLGRCVLAAFSLSLTLVRPKRGNKGEAKGILTARVLKQFMPERPVNTWQVN